MNATTSNVPAGFQSRPTPQAHRRERPEAAAERPNFARELKSQSGSPAITRSTPADESEPVEVPALRTAATNASVENRPVVPGEDEADRATFAAFQSAGIPAAANVDGVAEVADPDLLLARPEAFGLPAAMTDELPVMPESETAPVAPRAVDPAAPGVGVAEGDDPVPVAASRSVAADSVAANTAMSLGPEAERPLATSSASATATAVADAPNVPPQPQQRSHPASATSSTAPTTPEASSALAAEPPVNAGPAKQVAQPLTEPSGRSDGAKEEAPDSAAPVRANVAMNATKADIAIPDNSAAAVTANSPMKVAESGQPQPSLMPVDTAPIGRDNAEAVTSAVREVATRAVPGRQSVTIRLDPPQLGSVRVHVQIIDGQATATIATSNDVAHGLVRGSLDQLQQSLERSGVGIDRVQVTRMGSASAAENNANAGRDQHHQQQGDGQSAGRDHQQQHQRDQTRRDALLRFWNRGGFDAEAA